jgi:PHP family Zn ribbon phosphoesterase
MTEEMVCPKCGSKHRAGVLERINGSLRRTNITQCLVCGHEEKVK